MSELSPGPVKRGFLETVAFVRAAEPRRPVSAPMICRDAVIAATLLGIAVVLASSSGPGIVAAVLTCAPLVVRRRFPLTTFLVVLVCAFALRGYATDVTFVALVFAAYSAVVHSRFRGVALVAAPAAGALVAAVFWNAPSRLRPAGAGFKGLFVLPPGQILPGLVLRPRFAKVPGHVIYLAAAAAPWRIWGLLVMVSMASIAVAGIALHAADRIRRLKAEHQAATREAVEVERARIASDLHDVVTHNVSVMIVQAGAARQVLAAEPDQARAALLAVESSGRAAMGELRHLLGLLSPPQEAAGDGRAAGEDELRPQPGLAQVESLVSRVRSAGLPAELELGPIPGDLPAGVDLAAYRIVQEALTNVLKHAGKPATTVRLSCADGYLTIEVADSGQRIPAAGPAIAGSGRGLLGLRERVTLYGGTLDTGPRLGGGWLVRAQLPASPLVAPAPQAIAAQ